LRQTCPLKRYTEKRSGLKRVGRTVKGKDLLLTPFRTERQDRSVELGDSAEHRVSWKNISEKGEAT